MDDNAPQITAEAVYQNLHLVRGMPVSRPDLINNHKHSLILPNASYSPWLEDAAFQSAFAAISEHTLVDQYRGYELWDLVGQVASLPGDILEVGVWRGGTGCLIALRAQQLHLRCRVYLADTFTGVVKAGPSDNAYSGGEHSDTSAQVVKDLLQRNSVANAELLAGIFPDETGHKVDTCRFRLCHVDVDTYESARAIAEWVWPRMVVGGILIYDDYGWIACDGITRLIEERKGLPGSVTVYNLNTHGVVVKTAESPAWKGWRRYVTLGSRPARAVGLLARRTVCALGRGQGGDAR